MHTDLSELELYKTLLELSADDDPDVVLQQVLALAVRATSARLGYVAVGRDPTEPLWWRAVGLDDDAPEQVRQRISHTILTMAQADGGLIVTSDAAADPRFAEQASVRRHRIEAVLCAPLDDGVLYLQGRTEGGVLFDDRARDLAQRLVRHLGPLVRALYQRGRWRGDPTRPYREKLDADGLLGRSPAMARVLAQVAQVAPLDVSVLVTGASGTGKSVVAQVIHDNSPRRSAPLVAVNCASLRPDRLHADLFGAARGAYTGQQGAREGLVGAAHGGTLFLDEVGELPMEAQAQLLTFLQDGTYRRMGDERTRTADIRVLAATSADLSDRQRFREDLYWRLAAVPLRMPDLSERLDDLPELSTALVARIAAETGCSALPMSPAALARLEQHTWPGNVRELRQRLLSALLWAQGVGASSIDPVHLGTHDTPDDDGSDQDLRAAVDAFKRRHIRRVLDACDGNRTRAAEALGLSRSYLHEMLARWDDPAAQ